MTELSPESAASSERVERFSVEQQSELFFQQAVKAGRVLAQRRFPTAETAHEAGRQFVDTYTGAAAEINGFYGVILKVAGSGVKIPNLGMGMGEREEDEGKIVIDFHPGTPLVDLEPPEEKYGQYEGIVTTPISFADDTYGSVPYFFMSDKKRHSLTLNSQYGLPLTSITVENRMLVACDGSAQIEVPSLSTHRARNQAIAELALRSGRDEGQELMRTVHRFNGALYSESPYGFTQLRNIKDLQRLGEVGREYIQADGSKGEAVVAVIRETLGHGRPLKLRGEVSVGYGGELVVRDVDGLVIDVLSMHPSLDEAEPTLVLSHKQGGNGNEELCYVPVSRIQSLEF